MTLIDLFNLGMMRHYHEPLPDRKGLVLNLGAGEKHIDGAESLDLPEWDANKNHLQYYESTVDMIHCYHLLEHVDNVVFLMNEIRRVLKPGAHVNIVVPYYKSHLQASDLDHKHAFTERTFEKLFNTTYYSKGKIRPMEICTNFIMGDCEANICLVVQLRKTFNADDYI